MAFSAAAYFCSLLNLSDKQRKDIKQQIVPPACHLVLRVSIGTKAWIKDHSEVHLTALHKYVILRLPNVGNEPKTSNDKENGTNDYVPIETRLANFITLLLCILEKDSITAKDA
jgi:hypothetical protein